MAGEIQCYSATGRTIYSLIWSANGQIWNGSAFENFLNANYATYTTALVEQASCGHYIGTFPVTIPPGDCSVEARNQTGGSAAQTDAVVAAGDIQWGGTAVVPLSALASSGQISQIGPVRLARGVQILNFPFKMVSSVDHITPFTSGVISGQISRDGGAFGALQSGAFSEVGLGFYKTTLTSGDLLANTVALSFSAVGISGLAADNRDFSMVLQKTSGQ